MNTLHSRWLTLCVILTAPLLYVIDIFIINMALPVIEQKLNASQSDVQLVIAGYLLGSACFLIPAARAGDFLGRKKVFFWGMLAFTVTSCFCGLAQSPLVLNIARFFQGISSAFMVTQSLSLIQELFPQPAERAKAIGWYGMTLSIAAIIGQILGGYLVELDFAIAGWRLIFLINAPLGLASLWAIDKWIGESPGVSLRKFDVTGTMLLMLGIGALIYTLTAGREAGWPFWSVVAAMAGSLLLFLFFRYQQLKVRRNEEPLMDVGIFRHREFMIGLGAVLFHFMLHTAYLLMIAVYLQSGTGISALACGTYFIPHALLFMLSSFVASKLIGRHGKYILLTGLGIIMSAFILHILLLDHRAPSALVIALIGLYGLGNGLVLPFLLNIVLDGLPVSDAGITSGIFSTFQQIASALGISIIGGVFYQTLADGVSFERYKHALDNGLLVGLTFAAVVSGLLLLTPRSNTRPEKKRQSQALDVH
ncbi:drug resistance transporter, EmrB/QacA subfamily [Dyadobacter soli]|uniref:Drug resistance transporter, EmrB/QacA subfamily n=1 Tax=Dyadobacter soli TaxID=659014 RepID=A0A1G7XZ83_9BACT|nr:MFS transporter [Dyadobacter soli]SDG89441.1 drug resistance transporter, EmrB/QacA subfamily [Dyadobacter soli]